MLLELSLLDSNHSIQEGPLPTSFKVKEISNGSQAVQPTTTSHKAMILKPVTNRTSLNKMNDLNLKKCSTVGFHHKATPEQSKDSKMLKAVQVSAKKSIGHYHR